MTLNDVVVDVGLSVNHSLHGVLISVMFDVPD